MLGKLLNIPRYNLPLPMTNLFEWTLLWLDVTPDFDIVFGLHIIAVRGRDFSSSAKWTWGFPRSSLLGGDFWESFHACLVVHTLH